MPVPLHWSRENSRGFNQSDVYGKLLSNTLSLGYSNALKRVRFTRQQVGLKGKERQANIKGAFQLQNEDLKSKNVLIINDVWTTGSTLKECCLF